MNPVVDCQNNGYFHLPCVWTLPMSRRTLLFADMLSATNDLRHAAFDLVSDAAQRADNIGTDEVPTVEYVNELLLHADDAIAMYDDVEKLEGGTVGGKMVGLMIILPSRYVRSVHPSNCAILIVTGKSISSRLVWRDLARLGFDIASRGRRCYSGCLIDVFVTCFERVAALREEGFVVTACIPRAGLVAGFPGRHVDSYVMYKEISPTVKSLHLAPRDVSSNENDGVIPDDVKLLVVPYLPVTHVLADGTAVTIRSLQDHEDIKAFYAATKAAATDGSGYGVDELPSLAYFVRLFIRGSCCLVFELDPTHSSSSSLRCGSKATEGYVEQSVVGRRGAVVAYASTKTSEYSRSVNHSAISDTNFILLPEYRGRRWSKELQEVHGMVTFDVGFELLLSETSMRNIQILLNSNKHGTVLTGTIPRGIYFKDNGWTDLVTIHQIINESYYHTKLRQRQETLPRKVVSKI